MKLLKKILKSKTVQWLLVKTCAIYIKFCFCTARWQYVGLQEFKDYKNKNRPIIIAFWHGRLSMLINFQKYVNQTSIIISRHGDGEFITRVADEFKLGSIRGSSAHKGKERGGAAAIKETIDVIRAGNNVGITPDGPRGPRMRVSGAITEIARITGAPIVAITFSAAPSKRFMSWDRFMFPFPFSRAIFIASPPIHIPKDANETELEKYGNQVENALNETTRLADERMGIIPTEPENKR